MTSSERERTAARRDYKHAYYLKRKAEYCERSEAAAASRRADPELRAAFNTRQREYYAATSNTPEFAEVPTDEAAALKRAWRERFG